MLNIQTSDWAAGLLDFFPQTFMAQPTIITINVPKNTAQHIMVPVSPTASTTKAFKEASK